MRTTVDRLRWSAVTYEPYWLALCLLIGICLRWFRLEAQSLWADEGVQYFIASAPTLDAFWERVAHRTFHPPLSYFISHMFLRIHDSDFFLRLPSVLFGMGSILLAYWLVRKLTSVSVALVTMWLLAISPFHVWYSQEARMYAPLLFVALLSTLCFMWAVETKRWYWWGCYVCTLAAGMYIHVFMVLQIMVHGLWLLFWFRHAWLAYFGTGLLTAVLAFPVIRPWVMFVSPRISPELFEGVATGSNGRMTVGWEGILYTFYAYGVGFSLGPSLTDLHSDRDVASLLPHLPLIGVVAVVYGTLLMVGLRRLSRQGSWRLTGQCLIAFAGPIIGAALLTSMSSFSFNVRYTIISFPYFCLVVGAAVVYLGRRHVWLGTLALLVLTAMSTWSLANYFGLPYYSKTNLRAAVAHWRATGESSELLSVSPAGGVRDVVNRYLSPAEQQRHTPLGGGKTVDRVRHFFETHDVPYVYILFARDWQQRREVAVRNVFAVQSEQTFTGVKLLKIARQ